jgi:hypothetical protein
MRRFPMPCGPSTDQRHNDTNVTSMHTTEWNEAIVRRAREVPGPFGLSCTGQVGWSVTGLRQDLPKQDSPAHQGVAAFTNAGLHRQVEVSGFVNQAADFAGSLGDVQ